MDNNQPAAMPPQTLPGIGELLQSSIDKLRANFKNIAQVMALPIVTGVIFSAVMIMYPQVFGIVITNPSTPPDLSSVHFLRFGSAIFASLLITYTCYLAAFGLVLGKADSVETAFAFARKFFWRFIGVNMVMFLILYGGFLLLIVPGIILTFSLSMAGYLSLAEDRGIMDSLKRSYGYVRGYWGAVAGRSLAISLIFIIVQKLIEFGLNIVTSFVGTLNVPASYGMIWLVVSAIVSSAVTFLIFTPLTLIYQVEIAKALQKVKTETNIEALYTGFSKWVKAFIVLGVIGPIIWVMGFGFLAGLSAGLRGEVVPTEVNY